MKKWFLSLLTANSQSLPSLGAWIEEIDDVSKSFEIKGRSLRWERGLKNSFPQKYVVGLSRRSLRWERGLKIPVKSIVFTTSSGRSLRWERGLKISGYQILQVGEHVAPFAGSVD